MLWRLTSVALLLFPFFWSIGLKSSELESKLSSICLQYMLFCVLAPENAVTYMLIALMLLSSMQCGYTHSN